MNKRKTQMFGLTLVCMIALLSSCGTDKSAPNYTAGSRSPAYSSQDPANKPNPDPAKDELDQAAEDMQKRADTAVDNARHGAMNASGDAKDAVDDARNGVMDAADDAKRMAEDAANGVKEGVEGTVDGAKRMADDALNPESNGRYEPIE